MGLQAFWLLLNRAGHRTSGVFRGRKAKNMPGVAGSDCEVPCCGPCRANRNLFQEEGVGSAQEPHHHEA